MLRKMDKKIQNYLRSSANVHLNDWLYFLLEKRPFKTKRKYTYWQKPIEVYEIDGCRHCGGQNCSYSKYVDLMWCYDCKKEYYPRHC